MSGRLGGWVALEERKLRLTSAKVEVKVEAELGKKDTGCILEEMKLRLILAEMIGETS